MNSKKIVIGSIICLIWWINDVLSESINKNNTSTILSMPFTINANPEMREANSSKINTFSSTPRPLLPTTDRSKTIITTQTTKVVIPTVVPKNHKPSYQPHTEPGNIEMIKAKQQKWQIPSPLKLTTPDSKETNSSNRPTAMEKFSEREFIPSLEVGSFDNTEGFVPKIHQPKTLNFVQSLYGSQSNKPNRYDAVFSSNPINPSSPSENLNKQQGKSSPKRTSSSNTSKKKLTQDLPLAKTFSGFLGNPPVQADNKKKKSGGKKKTSNRRQGLMEEFEKDFDKLVNKYPELGDLMSGYPIMEEILKQKLAEMFQKSPYNPKPYSDDDYDESDSESDESEEKEDGENGKLKFSVNQALPYKVTNFKFPSDAHANVNIYDNNPQAFDGLPYPLDGRKPSWAYKKKPDDASPSIPAGGYYQNSKFPFSDDQNSDKKPIEEENPLNIDVFERPPVSPWKRAVHMLTAFLPVGLLISALTPSVININNTNDQGFPIRQRSADWNNPASKLSSALLEKLQGKFIDVENLRFMKGTSDNPVCDDWNFCELARKGEGTDASGVEKLFWQLAHEVPEHIAEKNGMKKVFKAIKSKDCSQFVCKDNFKPQRVDALDDGKKEKVETLLNLEDIENSSKIVDDEVESSSVKRDEPMKVGSEEVNNYNSPLLIKLL